MVPAAAVPTDEKTIAIVGYLWIIGFVIAIVMNKDNKKPGLATFHLRQMAGLLILSIGGWIVFQIIGFAVHGSTLLSMLIGLVNLGYSLALFVLWIIGFIGAINSQQKSIPVLGPIIQDKLKGLFSA